MNDIVICKTEHGGKDCLAAAFYIDMEMSLLYLISEDISRLRPGTVCIGKAENQQKNIGSTYIRIGESLYYLSGKTIKPGTELPVQITKNTLGKKRANVDTRLTLTGRYCVVSCDPSIPAEGSFSFSKKLSPLQKETVKGWTKDIVSFGYDVMLRTNAAFAEKKEVLAEISGLCGKMKKILDAAPTRTCFSVLYEPAPAGTEILTEIRGRMPDRIVTDRKDLYEKIRQSLAEDPWLYGGMTEEQIVLHEDDSLPLSAVYNLNRDIGRLLEKKVYLKSGAYLVIEKTEAFVSIDVNTGKCVKGRKPEETYRAVNLEAAKETARQIVLRNLSGMILVDFINLKNPDHRQELLNVMKEELRKDPLRSEAVDITKLGIMEIVRARKGEMIS